MEMEKIRTRIAPSPTGSPHIGTAYAALFNYVFAKKNNGKFILRIEDTDRTRFVEGAENEIHEALSWLGLETDESPKSGGKFGPYRQSERLDIYKEHTEQLLKAGKAYRCDCSVDRLTTLREDQQKRKEIPHYDRKCRYSPPKGSQDTVVRLAVPIDGETEVVDLIRGKVVFQNNLIDDQVLLKSDGFPTYHLAAVVDDHLMEISHVIRAEEWLSSTPKHVILYKSFGWDLPAFAHLPLLRNSDKSKISKRKNPVAIEHYTKEGYLPEALLNFLGLMGWSMPNDLEVFSLSEMVSEFSFDRVGTVGPVFDVQKLDWMNGEYIRSLSIEDIEKRILAGFTKYNKNQVREVLPLVRDRLKKLSEFDQLVSYFFEAELTVNVELINKVSEHSPKETVKTLGQIIGDLERIKEDDWKINNIEKILKEYPDKIGWSKTNFFQTIRVTVTGTNQTPPLFDILETIGKSMVLKRLSKAASKLV
jgi:glutamyl-tRNA synthetase